MGSFYTWIRRAADSPATAIAVLVALCALSVAGTFIENEELNRVSLLKSAPAHFGILRVLDSHTYVRDTIYAPSSLGFGETETTPLPLRPFFTSQPDPIARIGREFRYQPQSPLKLSGFTLDGDVVPGLAVDSASGLIFGQPTALGKYDHVKLSGITSTGLRVEQDFALYVDDRLLILGADYAGFDLLRRLLQSMKYVLGPGAIAALVSVAGGLLLGAFAGYYGGFIDRLLSLAVSVVQGIPALLAVFIAAQLSHSSIPVMMVVVGLSLLPETADGVRSRVRAFRARDFIEAAREIGMSDRSILWTEIVWYNCRAFLLGRVTQAFVYALLVDVTLSYAHFVDPNVARIGTLLFNGRPRAEMQPLPYLAPILLLLSVVAVMQFAERSLVKRWSQR